MKPPLFFKDVDIRRMYDRPIDTPRVSNLSPRVNIVYGPNATGKTTLARALNMLLWPHNGRFGHVDLSGRFELDGTGWEVETEGGRTLYRAAGRETRGPLLPDLPPSCYFLTLDELLQVTDNDEFATRIQLQAGGGYDVRKAAGSLDFKPKPPGKGGKSNAVISARNKRKAVEDAQQGLHHLQRGLSELEKQLEEARTARERIPLLEQAIEYHKALENAEDARQHKKAFPDVFDRIIGDELERLDTLRGDRDAAADAVAAADTSIDEAKDLIERNILPEEGLERGLLTSLNERLQYLKKAESERDKLQEAVEGARTRRDDAWRKIDGAIDPGLASRFNPDHLQNLQQLAAKSEEVHKQQKALDALHLLLGADDPETLNREREHLLTARQALIQWLQAPDPSESGHLKLVNTLLLVSLVVLVLSAGVLAVTVHWTGTLLLLVAFAVAYALYQLKKNVPGEGESRRKLAREGFDRSGVKGPSDWDAGTVVKCLDDNLEETAKVTLQLEKAGYWISKKGEREDLEKKKIDLEYERQKLLESTGLQPDFPEVSLWYLVEHLIAWQKADTDVRSAESGLKANRNHILETLQELNGDFARFGLPEVFDAAGAAGHIETLSGADRDLKTARTSLESAARERKGAETREHDYRGRIERLFEKLGLAPDDDEALQDLLSQYQEYVKVKEDVGKTSAVLSDIEHKLRMVSGFTEDLLERSHAELKRELAEVREVAGRYDGLKEQITEIHTQVKSAEAGNDLLVADSELARALEALRQDREKSYQAVAGHVLADYVYEQTRDLDLPEVFIRARELFSAFTKNRYRLEFDDAAFHAFDNVRNCDLALDQLSSSTRVQLLLAVRVAFLELQERGCRLPLLLDETLANSDDLRAEEIIHTILHLSNERQVFYFTAQMDEVAKWKSLDTVDQCCFVDLKPVPETRFVNKNDLPGLVSAPPSPNGDSHAEYGLRLGVPPWSPYNPPGALHLWYLIDDVPLLSRLLKNGYQTWGPLQSVLKSRKEAQLGIDDRQRERLQVIGHALDTWCEAWKTGRGKIVDRYILIQSDAVSDKFIDAIADLCKKCDGNAAELIERLEAKEVQNYGSKKITNLRDYFEENGYITTEEILSTDEIKRRVSLAVAADLPRAGMAMEDVYRVLGRIDPIR